MITLYYIVIIGTFVFFLLTFFIVYVGVYQNRKKVLFQEELMKARIEIKEQTLRHIAYELHDNLGQVASLIKINLNTIVPGDELQTFEKIEDTKVLIRQLIFDLKALSMSLHNDRVTTLGFVKALENEIEIISRTGVLKCELITHGDDPQLAPNTAIMLYRMSQEILNNALKHSRAENMTIILRNESESFSLLFKDDGVGFNLAEKESAGSGLSSLQYRAKLIKGQFNLTSSPGHGSAITVTVPI